MQAEIIAVGSEMLTADRVDTNSLYLTDQLNALGVEVMEKHVVGDHRERLAALIRAAAGRSQFVFITGGLGPTEDDLTREAVCDAFSRQLIYVEEVARALEERFLRMGRKMAEVNRRQAYLVEGAELLPNDRGTAPGQWIDEAGSSIVLLPGPPHEMKAMYERQCRSRVARRVPALAIRTLVFRVAGMPESDLDQLIAPVYTQYRNPSTTILAAAGDIQIHLRARCATEAEAMALLAEVGGPIEKLLGDRIYSRNGDPLEVVVGRMLRRARATVAVAESCTGGLLAGRLTEVPGSSDYVLGGFVTYTDRMKAELLGVPGAVLAEHGAVSERVAEAMANAARRQTGASFGVSVTGVAGPGGGSEATPVGTVWIGVADDSGSRAVRRLFLGDRARIRAFSAQFALDLLRRRCSALFPAAGGAGE